MKFSESFNNFRSEAQHVDSCWLEGYAVFALLVPSGTIQIKKPIYIFKSFNSDKKPILFTNKHII